MKCNDLMTGKVRNLEHCKISFEGYPDIWLRYDPKSEEKRAEIITQDPDTEDELVRLAERYPDDVTILSLIEDGGFHAIVPKAISIDLIPAIGVMSFIAD